MAPAVTMMFLLTEISVIPMRYMYLRCPFSPWFFKMPKPFLVIFISTMSWLPLMPVITMMTYYFCGVYEALEDCNVSPDPGIPANTNLNVLSTCPSANISFLLWRLPTPLLEPLEYGGHVASVHSSTRWKCTVLMSTPPACIYSCVYVINYQYCFNCLSCQRLQFAGWSICGAC